MTTFTFRVSDSLADRLSSAQMRSWIAEFLRQPHPLPRDPGSGPARVSLTLPDDAVRAVAGHLGCSASEALRRLVADAVGPSVGVVSAKSRVAVDLPSWMPQEAQARVRPAPRPGQLTPEAVNQLLGLIAWAVMVGIGLLVWYLISSRKGKQLEGNVTT
jgi:hypothetical protein